MRMRKYRQEFSAILGSTDSKLTKSRFKRLFWMAGTLTIIVLPVQFYILSQNASYPFVRYDWNAIHGRSWQNIIMVPTGGAVFFDRWIHIAIGLGMFFFFGLGAEAIKMYRGWLLAWGFDKIFPRLQRQSSGPGVGSTSVARRLFTSRACRFFTKGASRGSSVAPL
jgi:pheromone a factor receptor